MPSELKGSCLLAGTFVCARLSASVITPVLVPIRRRLIECAAARRAQLPKICRFSLFFFRLCFYIHLFLRRWIVCRCVMPLDDIRRGPPPPPHPPAPLIESAPPLALPVIRKSPQIAIVTKTETKLYYSERGRDSAVTGETVDVE